MNLASLGLALLAGLLSVLSPCVLPLLPILLGAAAAEHRLGPVALACGLALSFTAVGLFVAAAGFALGLDAGVFRVAGAALLLAVGIVLLLPVLQERLAAAGGPVSQWVHGRFGGFEANGVTGQFALGLLLGAVWSPCVGPTLGAASVLAAQGRDLGQVALIMAVFGLGAALPLLLLGLLSREALVRWRGHLMGAGRGGKAVLGGVLAVLGFLVLSGADKHLETMLVAASPSWLTELTARF